MKGWLTYTGILVSLAFLNGGCHSPGTQNSSGLGELELEVSGTASGREHFKKGLLLLHSFEYEDAREEFTAAQEADADMAMAYWGEAMTYNHSLWGEQDFEKARIAIERMTSQMDSRMLNEVEKAFIKAIKILYRRETPKRERDQAYMRFMRQLHHQYPQNTEISSFYALSLLASVAEGRDSIIYGEAAKVAQKVIDKNPNHPGALHYLIHSYDDPQHAQLALKAADAYAKVAPDASHALHMPSHIYVAMGMWDKTVRANERSYQASLARMQRKQLGNDARGYHAYHWLMYAYLQQGREDTARSLLLDMQKFADETPSRRARSHLVYLKGTYLNETDAWDDELADIEVDISDLNVAVAAQYHFCEGMKAFYQQDSVGLAGSIAAIANECSRQSLLLPGNDFKVCLSSSRQEATQTDINEAKVMESQLKALQAWLADDQVKTESWLKKAVALEEELSYSFGPPFIQKPSHELYGDWLLLQNRPEEARQQYELALKRGPGRRRPQMAKSRSLALN